MSFTVLRYTINSAISRKLQMSVCRQEPTYIAPIWRSNFATRKRRETFPHSTSMTLILIQCQNCCHPSYLHCERRRIDFETSWSSSTKIITRAGPSRGHSQNCGWTEMLFIASSKFSTPSMRISWTRLWNGTKVRVVTIDKLAEVRQCFRFPAWLRSRVFRNLGDRFIPPNI